MCKTLDTCYIANWHWESKSVKAPKSLYERLIIHCKRMLIVCLESTWYSKPSAPVLHLLDISSTSGISGQSFLVFWLQKCSFFHSFIITLGNICWALSLCRSLCQAFFMSYKHCCSPEISYSYYSQPQKRKVRNWEINYLGWSHSTNTWGSQDWNTGQSDSRADTFNF